MNKSITDYLTTFQAEHGKKAATYAARWLEKWDTFAGEPIDLSTMTGFRDWLAQSHYSAATCNRIMGTVGAYLKWLRRHGADFSRDDVPDAFQTFKVEEKLPVVMTQPEIRATLAYLATATNRRAQDHRIYVLLRLLTGIRHQEAIDLTNDDVEWETRRLMIDGRKTKRQRALELDTSPALRTMLSHVCNLVTRPKLCRDINPATIKEIFRKAGVPGYKRKVFRSTCAAYAASSALMNEYQLGCWFGHSSNVAIKHYRRPLSGITGTTVEEWMGCVDEANACVQAVLDYVPARGYIKRV